MRERKETLPFRVTEDEYDKLEAEARAHNTTMSDLVRDAVHVCVENPRKLIDVIAALLGSDEDARKV